ncbi:hypothetical protein HDU98_011117 [Podochytrium sp. JEL0797]|nr:hypothetical protein HDU98_011117 [Podochytrium sp. JEL0797]
MFRSVPTHFPRYPRFSTPTIVPHAAPSKDLLAAHPAPSLPARPTPATTTPKHVKTRPSSPLLKHHLTTTQTAVPLPTTFAHPQMTTKTFQSLFALSPTGLPLSAAAPLPVSAQNPYPYKYYQVTLRRGLYGIDKDVKKCVDALGLKGRHEVVWRPVGPHVAGLILKVRELVTVELVNEVPSGTKRQGAVKGYAKVGSALLSASA